MKQLFAIIILFCTVLFPQQNLQQLRNDVNEIEMQKADFHISAQPVNKKNAGLAIIYSLLLPGMGELYAGNYSSGKYFTIAEGALWLSYAGISTYGNWQEDRYKALAVSKGGINPSGKDEDYYATISEYLSIDEYNNEQALNRNFEEMYDTREFYWNWQNPGDRKSYRSMWVSSEQAYNNLRFVVGGLIVNRIISAINAVRSVSAYNKKMQDQSWNISVSYSGDVLNPGLRLNFQTGF